MSDRWPAWVYDEGDEPDYRFSFANERTFLAWIRTALAFLAAGVALDVVDIDMSATLQQTGAYLLIGLGLLATVASWVRWARAERAIRRAEPLPALGSVILLAVVLVVALSLLLIASGVG